ncbi:MAG TPA: AEC family transporter, partial [Gammaproteobacteria bacterium]|nr:AEC family transporter [Gammaproteobacteria bacterium]
VALAVGGLVGLEGETLVAVTLEAAMPSMVLGIVICDRYGLDSGLYAMAVTLTTAAGLVTLPLWFEWAGG